MPLPDFNAINQQLSDIESRIQARRQQPSRQARPQTQPQQPPQMDPRAQAMFLMMQGKPLPRNLTAALPETTRRIPTQIETYRQISKTVPLPAPKQEVVKFAPKTYARYLRGEVGYDDLAQTLERSKAERGVATVKPPDPSLGEKAMGIAKALPQGLADTARQLSIVASSPVQTALKEGEISRKYSRDQLRSIGQNVLRNKPLARMLKDEGFFPEDLPVSRFGTPGVTPEIAAKALILSQEFPDAAKSGEKLKTVLIQSAAMAATPALGLTGKAGKVFEKALFRPAAAGGLAGIAQYAVTGDPEEALQVGGFTAGAELGLGAAGLALGRSRGLPRPGPGAQRVTLNRQAPPTAPVPSSPTGPLPRADIGAHNIADPNVRWQVENMRRVMMGDEPLPAPAADPIPFDPNLRQRAQGVSMQEPVQPAPAVQRTEAPLTQQARMLEEIMGPGRRPETPFGPPPTQRAPIPPRIQGLWENVPPGVTPEEWFALLRTHRDRVESMLAEGKVTSAADVYNELTKTAGYFQRYGSIKGEIAAGREAAADTAYQKRLEIDQQRYGARDLLRRFLGEETGQIDPRYAGPVALGAGGALIGAATGDTPEERAKRAAYFGAAGFALPFMLPGIGVLMREAGGMLTRKGSQNLQAALQQPARTPTPKSPGRFEGLRQAIRAPIDNLARRGDVEAALQHWQQQAAQGVEGAAERARIAQMMRDAGINREGEAIVQSIMGATDAGEQVAATAENEFVKLLETLSRRERQAMNRGRLRDLVEGRTQARNPTEQALIDHIDSTGNVLTQTAGIQPLPSFFPRNIDYPRLAVATADENMPGFIAALRREFSNQFPTPESATAYAQALRAEVTGADEIKELLEGARESLTPPRASYKRLELHRNFPHIPKQYTDAAGRTIEIINDTDNVADVINHYRKGFVTANLWRAIGRDGEHARGIMSVMKDVNAQKGALVDLDAVLGYAEKAGERAPITGEVLVRGRPVQSTVVKDFLITNAATMLSLVSLPNQLLGIAHTMARLGLKTAPAILPTMVESLPLINRTAKEAMASRALSAAMKISGRASKFESGVGSALRESGSLSGSHQSLVAAGIPEGTAKLTQWIQRKHPTFQGTRFLDSFTRSLGGYANMLHANALLNEAQAGSQKALALLQQKNIPELASALQRGTFTHSQAKYLAQQGGNYVPRGDAMFVPAFFQSPLGQALGQFGRMDFAELTFGKKLIKDALESNDYGTMAKYIGSYMALAVAIRESQRALRGETPPTNMSERVVDYFSLFPVIGRALGGFRTVGGQVDPTEPLARAARREVVEAVGLGMPAAGTVASLGQIAGQGAQMAIGERDQMTDQAKRNMIRMFGNLFGGGIGSMIAPRVVPTKAEKRRQQERNASQTSYTHY